MGINLWMGRAGSLFLIPSIQLAPLLLLLSPLFTASNSATDAPLAVFGGMVLFMLVVAILFCGMTP